MSPGAGIRERAAGPPPAPGASAGGGRPRSVAHRIAVDDPAVLVHAVLGGALWPLAAAATVLAVSPLAAAFSGGAFVPLALVAAVLAVGIPAAFAATGRSATWSVSASAVAAVLFSLLATLHEPLGVADLGRGLAEGSARLLSETLPIASPRWVLVTPVLLCWLVGATSGELLARRRSVAGAAVCWIAGFVVALALTAGDPQRFVGVAAAFVAVVGVVLFTQRWLAVVGPRDELAEAGTGVSAGRGALGGQDPAGPRPDGGPAGAVARMAARWPGGHGSNQALPLRPLVLGMATLVVVTVASAMLVPRLPGLAGSPVAPARRPPLRSEQPVVPTDAVAILRQANPAAPAVTELTVRANRPFDGYLTLAILDRYDGDVWGLDRTFAPTGGRVPVAPGAPAGGTTLVQHYHLERALPFPWLPVVDRATLVSGVAIDAAPSAGMVVPAAPMAAGTRYTVVSRAPTVTLQTMGAADLRRPPASSPDPADLSVPASVQPYLAATVHALATQSGQAPARSLTFLAAVADLIHSRDALLDPVASAGAGAGARAAGSGADEGGTSLAAVIHAVMTKRQATPEQYATLFALVARYVGIPARLVTGFRLSPPSATPGPAAGGRTIAVTNRQAWTWVEIPVAGLGWVVADPTPAQIGIPALPSAAGSKQPTSTPPPTPAVAVSHHSGHALAPPVHLLASHGGALWIAVAAAGGVLALLVLGLPGSVWARRQRRRRRRQVGDHRSRVVGAWHEVLDTLVEHRCGDLRALTAAEVAAVAGDRFGADVAAPVGTVGRMADSVLYSEHTSPTDGDAIHAWDQSRQVLTGCRRHVGRWDRVRVAVRVAPGTTAMTNPRR